MKRYLLDSNAVTAFLGRREPFAERVRQAKRRNRPVGTCEPVVAELLFGIELSRSRDRNLVRLTAGLRLLRCWPLDRRASETFGRLAADLKRRGRPMQTIDMLLAAVALSLGNAAVVTTDSDLNAVPGLKVENWEAGGQES